MSAKKTLEDQQIKELKRHRRRTLAALVKKIYLLNRKKQRTEVNNLICEEFTKLGGVYIKFLQGVLLQSSLMRDWQSADRLKIFENLDSEPVDIQAVLKKELSAEKLAQLGGISPTPFAAGSFGQVYYATLHDGTQVIVKLLRPLVRETLAYDLKLLGLFSRAFASKLSKNVDLDVINAIDEFKRATMRETDYVEEARFGNELWEAYKDNDQFIFQKLTPNSVLQI